MHCQGIRIPVCPTQISLLAVTDIISFRIPLSSRERRDNSCESTGYHFLEFQGCNLSSDQLSTRVMFSWVSILPSFEWMTEMLDRYEWNVSLPNFSLFILSTHANSFVFRFQEPATRSAPSSNGYLGFFTVLSPLHCLCFESADMNVRILPSQAYCRLTVGIVALTNHEIRAYGGLMPLMLLPRKFGICTRSRLVQELWSGFLRRHLCERESNSNSKESRSFRRCYPSTVLSTVGKISSLASWWQHSSGFVVLYAGKRRQKLGFSAYISGRLRELEHAPPRRGGHVLCTLKKRFLLLLEEIRKLAESCLFSAWFRLESGSTAKEKMRSDGTCFLHFWSLWSEVW